MNLLMIATDDFGERFVPKNWQKVNVKSIDNEKKLARIACVVVKKRQLAAKITALNEATKLAVPVVVSDETTTPAMIEQIALDYQNRVIPKFEQDLIAFANKRPLSFTTPGHHNGKYFDHFPAGAVLNAFFGSNFMAADTSDTVPELGDMMMHQGSPKSAEDLAAKAYHADKVYFCTNGTSSANTICAQAILRPGDLVLFDRNNHKSLYNAALAMTKTKPVYLPADRNPLGLIGGLDAQLVDEKKLSQLAAKVGAKKATQKRPFRLAVLQTETYDGVVTSPKWLLKRLGALCDYVLFDCAWGGYEQFCPTLQDLSPLTMDLSADDPGILVTQSLHKQQAGFAQTSQILKKDNHIKNQPRYVDHERFNHTYLKYVTTSYSYPIYASLVANAAIASSPANRDAWQKTAAASVGAMKKIAQTCKYFKPFAPDALMTHSVKDLTADADLWQFKPEEKWHGFTKMAEGQAMLDLFKLTIMTPGVDVTTGAYKKTGIPASVVREYLLEKNIIPGKADLNSLLFLLTPADGKNQLDKLIAALVEFEQKYDSDASLVDVLPVVAKRYAKRYANYTIKQLCDELHHHYAQNNTWQLQRRLFTLEDKKPAKLLPSQADRAFMDGKSQYVPLAKVTGKIAAQGALPYPPGIFVVAPGEQFSEVAQQYFFVLLKAAANFPGFDPEIQGVVRVADERLCLVATLPEGKVGK